MLVKFRTTKLAGSFVEEVNKHYGGTST